MVHSPGAELSLITSRTFRRFLFEDAIDPETFREQHENLVSLLRGEGVNVIPLIGVLPENESHAGRIAKSPNLVYIRDTVVVTAHGYIKMRMNSIARRMEPQIVDLAMRLQNVSTLARVESPATMEGGDLIFLDGETLLLGVGNRTNMSALNRLQSVTRRLGLRRVIAVRLPPTVIHLDGTMMILDHDLAILHLESLKQPAILFVEGRSKRVRVVEFLRKAGLRIVEVTDYERKRRATNLVTLGPRKVIGYYGNSRVRRELEREGVDFLEFDGSELVRGGGGPRCMTAPILRD